MYIPPRRHGQELAIAALLAVLAGCGRDPLDYSGLPDGGAGTTNPGQSTTPGMPIPSVPGCVVPGCLVDLAAPCMPSGTCRVSAKGAQVAECYGNGVRRVVTQQGADRVTARVTKPNGDLCYTLAQSKNSAGQLEYTFSHASGSIAATATLDGGRMTVLCRGGTAGTVIELACAEAAVRGTGPSCIPGACM